MASIARKIIVGIRAMPYGPRLRLRADSCEFVPQTRSSPSLTRSFFSSTNIRSQEASVSVPYKPVYASKISAKLWASLEEKVKRFNEIQKLLVSGTVSVQQLNDLNAEKSSLSDLVDSVLDFKKLDQSYAEANALLAQEGLEKEMKELATEERDELARRLLELDESIVEGLIPEDVADKGNAILELRPAAGGLEASLFTVEMLNMYRNYSQKKNWKFEVLDEAHTDAGGIREAVLSVEGEGVFALMKFESGVHRVQRVPETEAAGRVHTSTMTVAVLPEANTLSGITLNDNELRIEVFRCGGAGGQHVNKTESGVRITHIPTGISGIGQADRSQHRNKEIARKILISKLYEIERSKLNTERDSARKSQIGSGERSERIRTYNYPQDRVTDHRLTDNFHGLDKMIAGDTLFDIHEALMKQSVNMALKDLESAAAEPEKPVAKEKKKGK